MTEHDTGQLLAALPMPAVLLGDDGVVEQTNTAATGILGTGLVGRHFVAALRQPAPIEAIETAFARGGSQQARFLATEGRRDTFWQLDVTRLERGVLLTFRDTTETEEALQMRRDFVANVSHELRSPVTALLGFVETLEGPAANDPAAQKRFLAVMRSEAQRMMRLVDDLLLLNRVEQNERRRPRTAVDLCAVAQAAVAALAPLAEARGTAVAVHLPQAPCTVPADADQIRQALGNLVENAIKYGTAGGTVDIAISGPAHETLLQGQGIRLSVHNDGPAIPVHHLPRLTERFYRVDDHRAREVGGTGLGLAIVKHVMNRHRGRLLIESSQGAGTTFTLLLPLA